MNKKTLILMGIVFVCGFMGLLGCVDKGKQPEQKKEAIVSVEAANNISAGWKTYVSKYGFSVSYPKDWRLEEDNDIKPSEDELAGFKNFIITSSEDKVSIGLDFTFNKDVVRNILSNEWEYANKAIPKDPKEKVLFLAKQTNRIDKSAKDFNLKSIKISNGTIYIIQDKDEKYTETSVLFYVEKTDALCSVDLTALKNGKYLNDLRFYKKMFMDIIRQIEINAD